MVLVIIVLIFFLTLILLHVMRDDIIEGATGDSSSYQDPGLSKDPLYLATVNAANIKYLYDQIGTVQNLNNQVQDLSGNVSNLDDQISGLSDQFADNTTDVTGGYDPTSGDTVETTGLE